ncbi:unnamed protein product, partial [Phaeothamnion confervicola]
FWREGGKPHRIIEGGSSLVQNLAVHATKKEQTRFFVNKPSAMPRVKTTGAGAIAGAAAR